uniref:Serum response factor-binding protein 1 n=1 Tax=Cuerna arida TaxID=1464854 RepID=A0A1B6FKA2_9HEMI
MCSENITDSSTNTKYEKYLTPLVETAKRTKALIENGLNKSVKRFKEEVSQVGSGEGKLKAEKKLNKVLNELQLLKALSEDEIVSFALSTDKNLMAIASNRRAPQEQRIKARVASRKPLSTFLARVKSETADSFVDQLVPTKLNKISLNNQIIRMRKNVKRAKVHVIHKLTRTIAMLRKSKGNEQLKAKHERKAERLTKKVKRIDELSEDEIAKFALTTTEDLNRLSIDIKMPMTTQAMATIAIHKFVAGPVEEYRKAFPDLPKAAPKLLKKKKRKNKLKIETKGNSKDHNEISNLISKSDKRNNNINDSEDLESDDDGNINTEKVSSVNDDSMSSEVSESDQEDEGDQHSDFNTEENNDMKKINFNQEVGDQHSDIDMDENMSNDSDNYREKN